MKEGAGRREDTLTTSHTLLRLLWSLHHSHLHLPEDLVKPGLQRLLDIKQQSQELSRVGRSGLDFLLLGRQIELTNSSWCDLNRILLDSPTWSISVVSCETQNDSSCFQK